ncbi:hypothetical protein JOC58_003761 [Paenibacillus hunanensis]|uniref:Uncharacterized protein n=1 Tax=Paenibacillus hunanensis TaxID=539262 RepID=A0ABU1J2W1_9BACL|nr:hypothetical protein [Paenibacillus hunanensis]
MYANGIGELQPQLWEGLRDKLLLVLLLQELAYMPTYYAYRMVEFNYFSCFYCRSNRTLDFGHRPICASVSQS